ncbi:MAG TPA: hypothetical protein VFA06_10885 [Actinocrinis sp.]|uniref:tetratricopeptide repeat protein n=1 Tax=Actinocrinis sp. TaxID=1920516 RepID=UPI002D5A5215|nr:hypothetical protein [Actinocrinis sp.]HZU56362.1 hypothetical protein [Actinocrinis sp.]
MDLAQLHAALAAADELPYGRERVARREELVALAEQVGDPAALASALLSLADDCQEDGDEQGMVLGFSRAWRIWQTKPEVFDAALRFRFREHFQHVVDVLDADERVPAAEVDRLMDEMESFYLTGGYSLRAVHRSRYWIHRRRGENELATLRIEALLAEDGDAGAACDACDLATAAYWYERQDDLPKAVDLWLAIIAGVRSCERPHVGIAHGEVMIDLLNLDRFDKARQHHRLGYPAIRRRHDLPRQLELHALFVNRTRDVLRGLEILHDHIDWLPAHRDAVGEYWWVHGRFLLFLKLLVDAGQGDLPITRSPRDIVTASALYTELDAVLADYAAHQDAAAGGSEHAETLESWRTAKLRHDELPPPSGWLEAGWLDATWPPIPMPWDARGRADGSGPRSLPRGFEPVDALAARARYLAFLRHPHACAAWEQVAASGTGLSDDVAAELSESRGTALAQRADHAAAHEQLAFAATLYATLGRTGDALRCRAMSAYQRYLVGGEEAAAAEVVQAEAWKAAQAEFEAGRITGGQLVTVRLYGLYRHLDRWRRTVDAEPDTADDGEAGRLVAEEAAEEYRTFRELADAHGATPQYAAAARAWVEVTAAMARMFARQGDEAEAAGYVSSLLDRLGDLAEVYLAVFQPWLAAEALLRRGQVLLAAHQPAEAESCARRVSQLANPPATPDLPGLTTLLLAEAINAQSSRDPDHARDDEVVQAAAQAARLLAGSDPVGAARARLLMGEVHHRAGRHETALTFYHPALSQILGRWEDDECRELIHLSALHYSISLCELDRARDAARVLRDVLAVVPEDYPTARAWLRHQLAEAAEQEGDQAAALEAYRDAARAGRPAAGHQPTTAALESVARLLAPTDIKAALEQLDDVIAHLRACDEDDSETRRYRDFLIAQARTLRLKHVVKRIEMQTLSEQEAAELLPPAQEAAEAGARELWSLLEHPQDGDAREEYVAALESGLKTLSLAIAVLGENPASASRWQLAFAEGCERWGYPEYARTARENAEYFASRAQLDDAEVEEEV